MPFLVLKNLPRYECMLEASKLFPDLDPSACDAFLHLLRVGDEAYKAVESHLAEHHLSKGRFMVLMLLYDKLKGCPHPRTPAELADLSQVTRATMTGLIDTLERDGLVTREPDRSDRRMLTVTLTSKGRGVIETILPVHFRRMAALMQPLDESERKMLVQLLRRVLQQAESCTCPLSGASPTTVPSAVDTNGSTSVSNHH